MKTAVSCHDHDGFGMEDHNTHIHRQSKINGMATIVVMYSWYHKFHFNGAKITKFENQFIDHFLNVVASCAIRLPYWIFTKYNLIIKTTTAKFANWQETDKK